MVCVELIEIMIFIQDIPNEFQIELQRKKCKKKFVKNLRDNIFYENISHNEIIQK